MESADQPAHNGRMSRSVSAIACFLAASTAIGAMQVALDPRAVNEAIAIGQSRIERDRTRFHEPYRLAVGRPPVDYVEVVTPFRRIVLVAESRAQIGDRSFGQRQALEMIATAAADLELRVEVTFHPLNTYVGVPDYGVRLAERGAPDLVPQSVERLPRFGPRVEGTPSPLPVPGGLAMPGGSQPLLGGTVVAGFDARALKADGVYDVVIEEAKKDIARVRADFGRMR
jgi:hypothetical protein